MQQGERRRSTGPRSAAGKARSAKNAVRHGLSVPVLADPELSREVRELAQRLNAQTVIRESGARGRRGAGRRGRIRALGIP